MSVKTWHSQKHGTMWHSQNTYLDLALSRYLLKHCTLKISVTNWPFAITLGNLELFKCCLKIVSLKILAKSLALFKYIVKSGNLTKPHITRYSQIHTNT